MKVEQALKLIESYRFSKSEWSNSLSSKLFGNVSDVKEIMDSLNTETSIRLYIERKKFIILLTTNDIFVRFYTTSEKIHSCLPIHLPQLRFSYWVYSNDKGMIFTSWNARGKQICIKYEVTFGSLLLLLKESWMHKIRLFIKKINT